MKTLRYIVPILILVAAGCGGKGSPAMSSRARCIRTLMVLGYAKDSWAEENHKTTNDVPVMADLSSYLNTSPLCPGGVATCPMGGAYTLGRVGEPPTCSIKGHELPP